MLDDVSFCNAQFTVTFSFFSAGELFYATSIVIKRPDPQLPLLVSNAGPK